MSRKLWLIVGVAMVALAAFAAVSLRTLAAVRIGSDRYNEIAAASELLADVLPPPEYLVESNLVAHRIFAAARDGDAGGYDDLLTQFRGLQDLFESRHAYWDVKLTDVESRDALLLQSYEPAVEFFRLANDSLIPDLEASNFDEAESVLDGPMQEQYLLHRAGIDAVVERSEAMAAAITTEAIETSDRSSWTMLAVLAAIFAALIAVFFVVVRGINAPLRVLRQRIAEIAGADGDLTGRMDVDRRDEFGEVATSFNQFVSKLSGTIADIDTQAEALLTGSRALTRTSERLTLASGQAVTQTDAVAGAAEEVTAAVSVVVTASDEMQVAIGEIARSASEAAAVAATAVEASQSARSIVSQLSGSSAEITDVTNLIAAIAEQTNLLALNATIESARAGEAGKGFAVVAAEVKELARATTQAVGGISERVEAIQADSVRAGAALEEIDRIITTVSDAQAVIAAAVEEQTATTHEIAGRIDQAASSVSCIATAVANSVQANNETASGAVDTGDAAGAIATSAEELKAIVGQFRH